jgi:adenylate cyclase
MPGTSNWEENTGLDLLFKLRGQRPAPEEVVIIAINGQTDEQLGLGDEIKEWPRSLHAELINRLTMVEAAVIVFDIFFKKAGDPLVDKELAQAIERAGNVILVSYLLRQKVPVGKETLHVERLVPPIEILEEAAAETAPFVLPKVPAKVSRFWTFNGTNALISLPSATLRQLADGDGKLTERLLLDAGYQEVLDEAANGAQPIYRLVRQDTELRKRLLERLKDSPLEQIPRQQQKHYKSLLHLYGGVDYPYLNFYGPPGSINTLPFQDVLSAPRETLDWLKGKVVFVGFAGDYQPEQQDGFHTVFTQIDGLELSGVEIAATAFANLLRTESITPLGIGMQTTLLVLYGLVITLLLRYLPGLPGITACLAAAGLWCFIVYVQFIQHHQWLAWYVPLVVQTPLALILTQTWHYRRMRASREHLRELFGYYLPGDVIDRLARDEKDAMEQSEAAFGVCLASDARNYTSMAESMDPMDLQSFLKRYYEVIFTPVRARGGVVSDVVGDAMLAIWPATKRDPSLQQLACEAALEINRAIAQSDLEPKLSTRIGLHAGELVMSHVGAIDHFEYRAVGDMVNTASRIENLNKLLGTSILASKDFVEELQGIHTRALGHFPVSGRQKPVTLYEISATAETVTPQLIELHEAFKAALADWQRGERQAAREKFEAILEVHPDDGPSNYYLQQYHERRSSRKNPLSDSKKTIHANH